MICVGAVSELLDQQASQFPAPQGTRMLEFSGLACNHLRGTWKISLEKGLDWLLPPSDIVDLWADIGTPVTFYWLHLDFRSCGFNLAFYNAYQSVLPHAMDVQATACGTLSSGL